MRLIPKLNTVEALLWLGGAFLLTWAVVDYLLYLRFAVSPFQFVSR
jgi:hypothetical protein